MLVFILLTVATLLIIVAGLFAAGTQLEKSEKLVAIVVSVVGGLLTFVGLIFAGVQIRAGAQQLEAASIYAMQKDGRELYEKSLNNTQFVDYVFNYIPGRHYESSTTDAARRQVGIIIQFYSSIYNQYKHGVLSNEAWSVAQQDLCLFVKREPVRSIWTDHLAKNYPDDFVEKIGSCLV